LSAAPQRCIAASGRATPSGRRKPPSAASTRP
jgi:hypothetical protein